MNNEVELMFDDGGGVVMQTSSFCHYYQDMRQAAQDYILLIESNCTSSWDGDEPEYRFTDIAVDSVYYTNDGVKRALRSSKKHSMSNVNSFLDALKI